MSWWGVLTPVEHYLEECAVGIQYTKHGHRYNIAKGPDKHCDKIQEETNGMTLYQANLYFCNGWPPEAKDILHNEAGYSEVGRWEIHKRSPNNDVKDFAKIHRKDYYRKHENLLNYEYSWYKNHRFQCEMRYPWFNTGEKPPPVNTTIPRNNTSSVNSTSGFVSPMNLNASALINGTLPLNATRWYVAQQYLNRTGFANATMGVEYDFPSDPFAGVNLTHLYNETEIDGTELAVLANSIAFVESMEKEMNKTWFGNSSEIYQLLTQMKARNKIQLSQLTNRTFFTTSTGSLATSPFLANYSKPLWTNGTVRGNGTNSTLHGQMFGGNWAEYRKLRGQSQPNDSLLTDSLAAYKKLRNNYALAPPKSANVTASNGTDFALPTFTEQSTTMEEQLSTALPTFQKLQLASSTCTRLVNGTYIVNGTMLTNSTLLGNDTKCVNSTELKTKPKYAYLLPDES